jgi:membrane-bound lytic murein transglycosylase B
MAQGRTAFYARIKGMTNRIGHLASYWHGMLFIAVLAIALPLATPVFANTDTSFATWLEGVRTEARKKGISNKIIKGALSDIKPLARIIKHDRHQSEFKLTLERYMKRVVNDRVVANGRAKAREHKELLRLVSRKYGVQSRVILAIWGIETRYGAVTANVPLIPSIATLAFDRRRSKYFRAQLFAVLEMLQKGYIDMASLKGSWAGAMGQPQFMPSSYIAYAQDFDGDGRRDIWNNTGDVFASIANYLARHGWKSDMTWGREVTLPAGLAKKLGPATKRAARGCRARTSPPLKLSEWQSKGVRRANGANLPTRDISAALVLPDGPEGKAYLVYKNYAAIMAYNCAHLYAITVGVLSDRIDRD